MAKTKEDWLKQFGSEPQALNFPILDSLASTGLRAVRFMRWQAMTSTKRRGNVAGIIVLNPDTFEPELPYDNVLVLRFWDHARLDIIDRFLARIFGRRPDLCVRVRSMFRGKKSAWPWRPPLAADAISVREFLENLPPGIDEIDVSCEYGRSRSRAIAEWIASRNGIAAIGNREKGSPNARLETLLRESDEVQVPEL